MLRLLTPALALALFALPAQAQDADPYAACAAMTDDAARLACFDTTHSREVVERAEQAAREEARALEEFGLQSTEETRARDELTITAAVVGVEVDGMERAVITLENGQVWREANGSSMRHVFRPGWVATLSRHWSGAYDMRFEGHRGVLRVTRIR